MRQKSARRLVWIATAAAAVVTAATVFALSSTPDSSPADAGTGPLPVAVMRAAMVDTVSLERVATGELTPRRSSLLSFEREGLVTEVLVDDGDAVQTGDRLAKLDCIQLEVALLEAAARLAVARARLAEMVAGPRRQQIRAAAAEVRELSALNDIAQRELERVEALDERNNATPQELRDAQNQKQAAAARLAAAQEMLSELEEGTREEQIAAQRATVQQLEAAVAAINVDIEKSTLRAPYDGVIALRQVDEGAVLAAGAPVVKLVETSVLEARLGVPVELAPTLTVGEQRDVRVGQTSRPAVVHAILPELDDATRTTTVVLRLSPVSDPAVYPGRIVALPLKVTRNERGVWLPLSALIKGQRGLWAAYAAERRDDGRARLERRDVEVLFTETDRAFVRGLINDGDWVVADGAQRVAPGQIIDPMTNETPEAGDGE